MNLFKSSTGYITDNDLSNYLLKLDLKNKDVLIYSRLLSLGRFSSLESIKVFINILKKQIEPNGTLIIPTYTLNNYKESGIINLNDSKIMSGILGEVASKDKDFKRSIHPVYSNCFYGKNSNYYMYQDATTCFGENSFFDLFNKVNDSQIVMLGLNFNGPTLYHYYDQKFNAPGRFIKNFNFKVKVNQLELGMKMNSYVKDYAFYDGKMNCLARFDALVNKYKLVETIKLGDDFIHKISEKNFENFYKICLELDQNYFLLSDQEIWNEYYMRNNYTFLHGTLDAEKCRMIENHKNFNI